MSSRPVSAALAVLCALGLAACQSGSAVRPDVRSASSSASTPAPSAVASTSVAVAPSSTAPSSPRPSPSSAPATTPRRTAGPTPARTSAPAVAPAPAPAAGAPVIVLDPGHSRAISAVDPSTGLDVSDYENEPEMTDVYAVAQLVRSALLARGYRVIMTKTSLDERVSLGQRAAIARTAHASLALSIHDQAGSNGGIGFRAGNNTVYYQSLGTYRSTSSGHRVYFTGSALAATSKRYGAIFAAQRQRVEGTSITLQGNTGYDLGGRGLAGGDIWMVQLLSHVPWIYNESGGNSAGRVGLDTADRATYAEALVASVEACIPPPR